MDGRISIPALREQRTRLGDNVALALVEAVEAARWLRQGDPLAVLVLDAALARFDFGEE